MGCPLKTTSINIYLNGNNLKRVYETKLLGVIFYDDLRFDEHVQKSCKSVSIKVLYVKLKNERGDFSLIHKDFQFFRQNSEDFRHNFCENL
jgi:hypothetical protein